MATAPTDDVHVLADGLQKQLPGAWQEIKGTTFPGDPNDPDQKVLFLAIARGLLTFVAEKSNLISQFDETPVGLGTTQKISNIKYNLTDSDGSGGNVTNL